jgi:prepilin-type N-terminal cleavage/methylation domain-containing protein
MHATLSGWSRTRLRCRDERGFTLAEMMVAMALMLIVCGAVTSALIQMTGTQRMIFNRTQMHSSVRGATELMQQEVGQAGRIALPTAVTIGGSGVTVGTATATVSSSSGMFVGELLVIGGGSKEETVTVTAVPSATQFTATFAIDHASGESVQALGGFYHGIVPPSVTNGSTASVLKMFGDLNGDGSMVYVEYTCNTAAGSLYRNSMAWDATSKPTVGVAQILLNNIIANPSNAACFTYQTSTVGTTVYVIGVAITLTVQTQQIDSFTKTYQRETKALLNVSPRNIFNVWQLASAGVLTRAQPTPPQITTNLLP